MAMRPPSWKPGTALLDGRGWAWACGLFMATASASAAETQQPLRILAATTLGESRLLQTLADGFRLLHPDVTLDIRTAPTLTALHDARRGRADMVITHDRFSEDSFVEQGHALQRVQFMYEEYAIFGPPADPLKLAGENDLIKALKRLALDRAPFLTPAAQTGTALKIAQLWQTAGVKPQWPDAKQTGSGTAATLRQAAQRKAYTLASMGTYLANRESLAGNIAPLFRDHPSLRNPYSVIIVNPERLAKPQTERARLFLAYLVSDAGQELITRFGDTIYQSRPYTASAHLDPGLRASRQALEQVRKNRVLELLVLLTLAMLIFGVTLALSVRRYRQAEAARRTSEERFALAVSGTHDAMWDWDMEKDEVYFSPRWKEMLGYVGYDSEIENSIDEWKDRIHPDDRELVLAILDSYIEGRSPHFFSRHRLRTKRGDYVWVLERGKAMWNKQGKAVRLSGSVTDISQEQARDEQTGHQTLYDRLTDLPNQTLFLDRVQHALHHAVRNNTEIVVLLINLNRFQEINDSHGRAAGDQALTQISQRLLSHLRRVDTAARLGNDEFGILLPQTPLEQAMLPLQRLLRALELPLDLNGEALSLSTSMGVVVGPRDGDQAEILVQRARVALHAARRAKMPYTVYTPAALPGANLRIV